jgi:hypothetical protein
MMITDAPSRVSGIHPELFDPGPLTECPDPNCDCHTMTAQSNLDDFTFVWSDRYNCYLKVYR